jgi:DNA-binding transcriptional regulator YhcF (GntR family)
VSSIDRVSPLPIYEQVAAVLRTRIVDGVYPQGGALPTARALCQECDVGRDAVIDALALLRSEGLITTRRGRRPTVRRQGPRTFRELRPGEQVVARMPSAPEVRRLRLDPGVPVLEIGGNGEPCAVMPADRFGVELPRPR